MSISLGEVGKWVACNPSHQVRIGERDRRGTTQYRFRISSSEAMNILGYGFKIRGGTTVSTSEVNPRFTMEPSGTDLISW